MFLESNVVICRNKKKMVCVRSKAEAECRAVALRVFQLLWLKVLLEDMEMAIEELMKIYCDIKATINLSSNRNQNNEKE